VRRAGALLILGLAALTGAGSGEAFAQSIPWIVYYADKEPPSAFDPYKLVIFDSDHHPKIDRLHDRGKTVVGYLSVGEVEDNRPWFKTVASWGVLGKENPDWKGSRFVDLRDPRWTKLVIETLIPRLLHAGFDGVFLDTLDNAAEMERVAPKKNAGMTEAAYRLVAAIRRTWPDIVIVQNRGFEILQRTAPLIDYALGESLAVDWDFAKKRGALVSEAEFKRRVEPLKGAKRAAPKLELLSLDYWEPTDAVGVRRIYALQRANGLSPVTATVELDRIVPEPR